MAGEFVTLSQVIGKAEFHPASRLDSRAELLISTHLESRRLREDRFPVTCGDLSTLLENMADDLDLYADLAEFGDGVEGATFFRLGRKPIVKIAQELSEAQNDNRLKSTLAHELGHVALHDPHFQSKQQARLFPVNRTFAQVSFRDGFSDPVDRCPYEYQAWYFCGAILMPRSEVVSTVRSHLTLVGCFSDVWKDSELGLELVQLVAARFGVSSQLARIHLLRTKVITDAEPPPSLF